jgi:hypothetical protein
MRWIESKRNTMKEGRKRAQTLIRKIELYAFYDREQWL